METIEAKLNKHSSEGGWNANISLDRDHDGHNGAAAICGLHKEIIDEFINEKYELSPHCPTDNDDCDAEEDYKDFQ